MNEIVIRPWRQEDWPAFCAIHDAARKMELALAGLEEAFRPLAEIAGEDEEDLFGYKHLDAALVDGEVAGFCAYTGEELAWLYVDPARQRQGIGRALTAHALREEPGICAIEALVGNEPARRLYEFFGFRVEEVLTGKMPGNEGFTVQVYSMGLQPPAE